MAVTQSLIAGREQRHPVRGRPGLPARSSWSARIYGEPAGETVPTRRVGAHGHLAVGYVVITAALVWFVWFRYRRIEVTR